MTMRKVIKVFKSLTQEDFRILNAIERGMAKHEYVPVEEISRLSGVPPKELLSRTKVLNELGLIQRQRAAYVGFMLTTWGYDCLALNALVKRGVLKALSLKPLGVGKESDVYEGLSTSGERVAVKFHRLGRTSFRMTRRVRAYVGGRRHISWLYQARLAATSEFEALSILYPSGVSVPRPIWHNRHVVVTSLVEGEPLFEVPPLEDPRAVLGDILLNLRKAYRAGVVHGDMSEYNVLVCEGERVVLIDWPQWVSSNHPSAELLLRRDVTNLVKFFRRKYRVAVDPGEALKLVMSSGEG